VTDLSRESLDSLRRRAQRPLSDAEADLLVAALRADSRLGARELARRIERRRLAVAAERERVERLFHGHRRLLEAGARHIAGVDEVGMGPLAGPVVAVAVVLPESVELPGLNDSKRLSRAARERLSSRIREQAIACSAGVVAPAEIDRRGIYQAGLEAMRRAVESLDTRPDHVVVDARTIPGISPPQTAIVGGDRSDGSIAAASIVAKVYRDAIMRHLEGRYPGYGFGQHMGYGTQQHLEALRRLGPSPVHRRSFAPVAQAVAR